VDVCFGHFLLVDPFFADERRTPVPHVGLIEPSTGLVRCRTAYSAMQVRVSAVVSAVEQPGDLSFHDVVETSYRSATGRLGIADWQRRLVEPLPPLPGAGWYRLRYHLRNPDDEWAAECLIQAWPGEPSPSNAVKVTSKMGRFWHSRREAETR
jgi:hypothetical protein